MLSLVCMSERMKVTSLKKDPDLSGESGSSIRGISMNCELIPRAVAEGHSSGFCGFALAGSSTFPPESAVLASRDEEQTLRKITPLPREWPLNMKTASAGVIKPAWLLTPPANSV